MVKKIGFLLALAVLLAVFNGCSGRGGSGADNRTGGISSNSMTESSSEGITGNVSDNVSSEQPTEKETDAIKELIGKMTLDEKIGQMVIVGVDDYTNNSHSTEMIEAYHVGGFILFDRNIKDPSQALGLINSLKETNAGNKSPLFIGVDEEGGRVTRMPVGLARIPTNKAIGQADNSDFSYEIGKAIGGELKAFGMNMNFAPVLDINSNPKNPVIGDRSFGANPEIVSKLGVQTMKGLQSQNIISVVKHFPGHGDTSVDSHKSLPVVNHGLDRLKAFELLPFAEAVKNNADAVMVAHILLPEIDKENPASLSKAVITDILRGELKFNGVVITDDMTMGAIIQNYGIGEAAVKSVNAGSDIVLVCHEYDKEISVIKALKAAAETGTISEDTINDSVYRILKLKQKYGLADETLGSIDVDRINASIKGVLNRYMK